MADRRCVIIGASPDTDTSVVKENVHTGDFVVCADGGRLIAEKAGIKPDIIIGDFDSSSYPENASCEIISLPVKKDDTDTLYCIKECAGRGYNDFVLLGMTGGRADHSFANYCSLLYLAESGMKGRIIDSAGSCEVVKDGTIFIEGKEGHGFGIFPFGCASCTVTLSGFLYEIESTVLTAGYPIGVSNEITSNSALVSVLNGTAIIFIL